MGEYVGDVNGVLVFRDEQGREWLAGAVIGPLTRYEDGAVAEQLDPDATKDRAFLLTEFKIVAKR